MELKVSHCFIPVHDHDEALAFYRDVLGLEVRNDVNSEGMGWETVGPRAQPDLNLVLEPPAANPSVSPQDKKVMSELLANGVWRGARPGRAHVGRAPEPRVPPRLQRVAL